MVERIQQRELSARVAAQNKVNWFFVALTFPVRTTTVVIGSAPVARIV